MRSPILGAFLAPLPLETTEQTSAQVCEITHRHPLGIEGARLVSVAAWRLANQQPLGILDGALTSSEDSFQQQLAWAREHTDPTPSDVVQRLGHGISATESVVTALYLAERHLERPFEELVTFAKQVRGDVDTILAIAGALWGIRRGASDFPYELVHRVEGARQMRDLAHRLAQARLPLA